MHAGNAQGRLPDDQAGLVVEVFRMLADATRVQVLWSLAEREMSVNELAEPFDISKLEKVAGTCTFARMTSKGGRVNADVLCKRDGAPDTRLLINGTTGPTGFDVKTENRTGAAGQPGYSLVRMRTSGKRIGGC